MPWARDTYSTLRQRALADIAASLPGADPFQRRTVLNVLGTLAAKLQDAQFGYQDWQLKQSVPFTAEGEYLIGFSSLKGVFLEGPTGASGNVVFTGAINQPVPSATALQTSDGSQTYIVSVGGSIGDSGSVSLLVRAANAGSAGDLDAGAVLTLVSPLSGIDPTATVDAGGIGGGSDIETAPHLRTRMLQRYAAPPQGGADGDYVGWALAVPGVTRAWTLPAQQAGTGIVTVFFMMDTARASHNGLPQGMSGKSQYEVRGIFPASGDPLLVADAIYPQRPAGALVYAASPQGVPLNLTLKEVPNDTTVRNAIMTALGAFIVRESSPGGVQLAAGSAGGVLRLSHLEAAIAAVPGLDHFVIASPIADIALSIGQISIPGTITYS